jgi:hypothetical protein
MAYRLITVVALILPKDYLANLQPEAQ